MRSDFAGARHAPAMQAAARHTRSDDGLGCIQPPKLPRIACFARSRVVLLTSIMQSRPIDRGLRAKVALAVLANRERPNVCDASFLDHRATSSGGGADWADPPVPNRDQSLARASLPVPTNVQQLHDPGGPQIRTAARRLAWNDAHRTLPSVPRRRLRSAVSWQRFVLTFGRDLATLRPAAIPSGQWVWPGV